jgi:hypothetical protein
MTMQTPVTVRCLVLVKPMAPSPGDHFWIKRLFVHSLEHAPRRVQGLRSRSGAAG